MSIKTLLPIIITCLFYSKLFSQYFINPYIQQNDTTMIYYGSGDLDSNGAVNWDDYNSMISNVKNEMADLDGDGFYSTSRLQGNSLWS